MDMQMCAFLYVSDFAVNDLQFLNNASVHTLHKKVDFKLGDPARCMFQIDKSPDVEIAFHK